MLRTALIVAGGSGSRMGADIPKQFLPLAGKPVLVRTVAIFLALEVREIVLVLPTAHFDLWKETSADHLSQDQLNRIHLTAGGASRTDSVKNGLLALADRIAEPEACLVAIHDGVRPLVPKSVIQQAFMDAEIKKASVVAVPVKASLRESDGGRSKAVDRSRFWEVQTPQTFHLSQILTCYQSLPEGSFTDDASLFEAMGGIVALTSGSYENLKLTTPEDMIVAERILERREKE
ncbi:MAG: 2-C-methyl-D-erythritol 4-phosphate cytidylyltransferase [Bacteroidota bacterium]